ncbi:MAG: hypothetical protein ACYC2O_06435, partial [Microthrixaceae bacterium]
MRRHRHDRGARALRGALALWVLAAATVLGVIHPVAAADAVARQQDPDVRSELLDISSVTPWVSPDGEFQVRFAPSTAVPAGAELTYTIHQALAPTSSSSLRAQVEAVLEDGTPGRILQRPTSRLLAEYGDPTVGSTLTIPVRSQSGDTTRALLPNPGIHPVELVLTDPTGPELWRQVVFLNRLPNAATDASTAGSTGSTSTTTTTPRSRDVESAPPVAVTLLVPIDTPPVLDAAGVPTFDLEQRTTLAAATSLLTSVPGAPLTLGVRPNTLDGLARTAERWSDRLIGALRAAVATTGGSTSTTAGAATLLGLPYVHV